jgi:hypothetical protein
MKLKRSWTPWAMAAAVGLVAVVTIGSPASAAPIFWTDWTSATFGQTTGSAAGNITLPGPSSVSLSYGGQVFNSTVLNDSFPSWGPASTFSGGTVGDPPNIKDIIALTGGPGTGTNTLTFSQPVVDPVMAIWSLGCLTVSGCPAVSGVEASFVFSPTEPFTIESGGPSSEFGGTTITAVGSTVSGVEGNGTVQFHGTFSQLVWTNPLFESFYGFQIGIPGPSVAVPEPGLLALFASGFAGLAGLAWRRYRQ